ncbi:MAG: archease [Lentisphaeria bacterium]|nr:archease [Lentisphaeria bacterium]
MRSMPWLTLVPHTADGGIRVTGPSRRKVFERAARGMFSLLTDLECVRPSREWDIEVAAPSPEELLVAWLSELNVRHQTEHVLLCRFRVQALSDTALRAGVSGEPIDPARHEVLTEIKAVTYCGLELGCSRGVWVARVIFDL